MCYTSSVAPFSSVHSECAVERESLCVTVRLQRTQEQGRARTGATHLPSGDTLRAGWAGREQESSCQKQAPRPGKTWEQLHSSSCVCLQQRAGGRTDVSFRYSVLLLCYCCERSRSSLQVYKSQYDSYNNFSLFFGKKSINAALIKMLQQRHLQCGRRGKGSLCEAVRGKRRKTGSCCPPYTDS